MNHSSKIHGSEMISVPFKWEEKPGISKLATESEDRYSHNGDQQQVSALNLPPPPCWSLEKPKIPVVAVAVMGGNCMQIPPPPCTSHLSASRRRSNRIPGKKEKDPFLAAYEECTRTRARTITRGELNGGRSHADYSINHGVRKNLLSLSCKNSYNVRDDALVVRDAKHGR
ncbi:hypothetical protein Ancab_016594 [Ancistrocladus abbreviatus]